MPELKATTGSFEAWLPYFKVVQTYSSLWYSCNTATSQGPIRGPTTALSLAWGALQTHAADALSDGRKTTSQAVSCI